MSPAAMHSWVYATPEPQLWSCFSFARGTSAPLEVVMILSMLKKCLLAGSQGCLGTFEGQG